ncbi:hypothetical protein PMIN01_01365 [Paraphaeosphaeria minitans]|uniref:Uncharacterized protein n=1 Tax=Paraphaeosphaeria minitans TaxID=565426 RepID=A0A9P6GUT7_9PLEO|nr:hypothetical protein PMIN01_01365 [Paraphaeosphaeria minitans]
MWTPLLKWRYTLAGSFRMQAPQELGRRRRRGSAEWCSAGTEKRMGGGEKEKKWTSMYRAMSGRQTGTERIIASCTRTLFSLVLVWVRWWRLSVAQQAASPQAERDVDRQADGLMGCGLWLMGWVGGRQAGRQADWVAGEVPGCSDAAMH